MIRLIRAAVAGVFCLTAVGNVSTPALANGTEDFVAGLAVAAVVGAAIATAASKKQVTVIRKPAVKKVSCHYEDLPVENSAGKQIAIKRVQQCS
jgi:hypothetical protein